MLEKTLESPLDCKEIQPVHSEGDQGISLEGMMLNLKLQYFGHLVQRVDSLEKTLMLEGIEGRRKGAQQNEPMKVFLNIFMFTNVRQFSSVIQLCPTLCNPMNRSTPGLPVHHQLPEFTQTHIQRVSDAIQPSHPRSSPSPPAPNPSQHQSLFQ